MFAFSVFYKMLIFSPLLIFCWFFTASQRIKKPIKPRKAHIYGLFFDSQFIFSKYNTQATEKLVFVEDFIPSNKESGHYRTEFRLTAYNDAIGKSYLLGDKVVDLVASPTIFGEIEFRVYTNDISFEQVIALIQGMSPIMDENLAASELQETITEVTTKKTANGYYYGELGIILFGSDSSGYELMIKND